MKKPTVASTVIPSARHVQVNRCNAIDNIVFRITNVAETWNRFRMLRPLALSTMVATVIAIVLVFVVPNAKASGDERFPNGSWYAEYVDPDLHRPLLVSELLKAKKRAIPLGRDILDSVSSSVFNPTAGNPNHSDRSLLNPPDMSHNMRQQHATTPFHFASEPSAISENWYEPSWRDLMEPWRKNSVDPRNLTNESRYTNQFSGRIGALSSTSRLYNSSETPASSPFPWSVDAVDSLRAADRYRGQLAGNQYSGLRPNPAGQRHLEPSGHFGQFALGANTVNRSGKGTLPGPNAKQHKVSGGAIQLGADTRSSSDFIRADGTLTDRRVDLYGEMQFARGSSHMYAPITAHQGSRISLSQGANSHFYRDLEIKGGAELQIADHSTATFYDHVQFRNNAIASGGGNAHFLGSMGIGNSPGRHEFPFNVTLGPLSNLIVELGGTDPHVPEFDQFIFKKNLTLQGGAMTVDLISLTQGGPVFQPSKGDQFKIIDVHGTWTGTFGTINLPTLPTNLLWDVSQLYSSGTLATNAVVLDATWLGGSGTWSNPSAWSTADFPNNGNGGGFDYNAIVNGGTVSLDQNIVIEGLTLSGGGTISGSHDLAMNAASTWTNGTMTGSGTTNFHGDLALSSGSTKFVTGGRVINSNDTTQWTGGDIDLRGTTWNNLGTRASAFEKLV
ncbi:MAG TPA: hypothetical protein PKD64_12575 [Pirellulaceae bacterium]|nr:hypothetical protein [Pirellulaceae bacterium]HMO93022.1 hypothetical protein [Pirellulaceae bacterium]HMP69652.1 hypothetical protein [Pirellulaceae bacterium]